MNKYTESYYRLMELRDGGAVKRTHTCRTLRDVNVAEHSHGVAMIVLAVHQTEGSMPSANLLAAALCHDLSELATGDVPAHVKRQNPEIKAALNGVSTAWEHRMRVRFDLSKDEQDLLLWADRLEFALYATEEVRMGNRYAVNWLARILTYMHDMPIPIVGGSTVAAYSLLRLVQEHAKKAIGDQDQ